VDTKSCLPTLPIPNRPPFAVRTDVLGGGELRVHLQQLPDAHPAPPFEVTLSGSALQIIVAPKQMVAGTLFCDAVVRVTNVPAGDLTVRVASRNPGTNALLTLGASSVVSVR
jgi:hypothetical protein